MTYYSDDWLTIHEGDCREVMASMEPESVHCVVTSPPYWGLRDYGVGGQLGLEPTPEAYVESMVAVFREVRRVLRADGTVWLNLGDSYANPPPSGTAGQWNNRNAGGGYTREAVEGQKLIGGTMAASGLAAKNLVGIPWRVAFALQADGWYLRSDIIWAKPNPMPESVTDRPTKAHEYLFLLSKSPRYYYDADAVREAGSPERPYGSLTRQKDVDGTGDGRGNRFDAYRSPDQSRNLRSVWSIATQPYPGAHFATFPEKLVEPCILAGTSAKGVCPECGAPWVREVERNLVKRAAIGRTARFEETGARPHPGQRRTGNGADVMGHYDVTTTGWHPTCNHVLQYHRDVPIDPIPATVLDPFAGSGTTARVAARLSRRAVLIDLNADYLRQAMKRNHDIPLGLESA